MLRPPDPPNVFQHSWKVRATPLFREGSASPNMIRTGRLNSFSLATFVRAIGLLVTHLALGPVRLD